MDSKFNLSTNVGTCNKDKIDRNRYPWTLKIKDVLDYEKDSTVDLFGQDTDNKIYPRSQQCSTVPNIQSSSPNCLNDLIGDDKSNSGSSYLTKKSDIFQQNKTMSSTLNCFSTNDNNKLIHHHHPLETSYNQNSKVCVTSPFPQDCLPLADIRVSQHHCHASLNKFYSAGQTADILNDFRFCLGVLSDIVFHFKVQSHTTQMNKIHDNLIIIQSLLNQMNSWKFLTSSTDRLHDLILTLYNVLQLPLDYFSFIGYSLLSVTSQICWRIYHPPQDQDETAFCSNDSVSSHPISRLDIQFIIELLGKHIPLFFSNSGTLSKTSQTEGKRKKQSADSTHYDQDNTVIPSSLLKRRRQRQSVLNPPSTSNIEDKDTVVENLKKSPSEIPFLESGMLEVVMTLNTIGNTIRCEWNNNKQLADPSDKYDQTSTGPLSYHSIPKTIIGTDDPILVDPIKKTLKEFESNAVTLIVSIMKSIYVDMMNLTTECVTYMTQYIKNCVEPGYTESINYLNQILLSWWNFLGQISISFGKTLIISFLSSNDCFNKQLVNSYHITDVVLFTINQCQFILTTLIQKTCVINTSYIDLLLNHCLCLLSYLTLHSFKCIQFLLNDLKISLQNNQNSSVIHYLVQFLFITNKPEISPSYSILLTCLIYITQHPINEISMSDIRLLKTPTLYFPWISFLKGEILLGSDNVVSDVNKEALELIESNSNTSTIFIECLSASIRLLSSFYSQTGDRLYEQIMYVTSHPTNYQQLDTVETYRISSENRFNNEDIKSNEIPEYPLSNIYDKHRLDLSEGWLSIPELAMKQHVILSQLCILTGNLLQSNHKVFKESVLKYISSPKLLIEPIKLFVQFQEKAGLLTSTSLKECYYALKCIQGSCQELDSVSDRQINKKDISTIDGNSVQEFKDQCTETLGTRTTITVEKLDDEKEEDYSQSIIRRRKFKPSVQLYASNYSPYKKP